MLVYGDHEQIADTREELSGLRDKLARVSCTPPGLERHAKLVGALIDAGRILQGVADADFAIEGVDRRTPATDELGLLILALAKAVCASWRSSFAEMPQLPAVQAFDASQEMHLRTPEGFAYYALYPEAYAAAAGRLKLCAPARVIGIRSIGTTLAAMVAAALDAAPPVTVRPFGDPFNRKIALSPALERALLEGHAHYVIVDEGPGLSGSSFGAVADWLEGRGVPLDRIAFVPSHAGQPGPHSSEAHRERWRNAQRVVADFGNALPGLLMHWVQPLLGPIDAIEDISAGNWRRHWYRNEDEWPAVTPAWERRKFLVSAAGERFLLKFAGLGALGEHKLAMAQTLHSAGFAVRPIGLAHGVLVEPWHDDARPLSSDDRPAAEIGRYVGTRARMFPAESGSGASLSELFEMTRTNVAEAFGESAAQALDHWHARLGALSSRVVRVRTDGRLQRHEWLHARDGQLIKTDALDHHMNHELVGCQDMAWDIAGAMSEFGLDEREQRELISAAEDAVGRTVDRELLDFYRASYAAFALGRASLGAELSSADPSEQRRLRLSRDRYGAELKQLLLEGAGTTTRLECLVG